MCVKGIHNEVFGDKLGKDWQATGSFNILNLCRTIRDPLLMQVLLANTILVIKKRKFKKYLPRKKISSVGIDKDF